MRRFRSLLYRIMSAILAISMIMQTIPAKAIAESTSSNSLVATSESTSKNTIDAPDCSDASNADDSRQNDEASHSETGNAGGQDQDSSLKSNNTDAADSHDIDDESSSNSTEYSAQQDTASSGWNNALSCEWRMDDNNVLTIRPLDNRGVGYLPTSFSNGYFIGAEKATSIKFSGEICAPDHFSFDYFQLKSIDLTNLDTSKTSSMSGVFAGQKQLKSIDLSNLDTQSTEDFSEMFSGCKKLKTLDLSALNTSSAVNMSAMFRDCSSLEMLDFSNLDLSNLINMSYMFERCSNLKEINLNNVDTSSVKYFEGTFLDCSSLVALNLSSIKTSASITFRAMFRGCASLQTLDLSSFDTQKVEDMSLMFEACSSLYLIDLSSFNTSNVSSVAYMFSCCSALRELDITSFVLPNNVDYRCFINSNTSLKVIKTGNGFPGNWNINLPNSYKGNKSISWEISDGHEASHYASTLYAKGAAIYFARAIPGTFPAVKIDLSDEAYTGHPITKQIVPKNNLYLESVDYSVAYQNNIDAGVASVIIKGIGVFSGSGVYTFRINPIPVKFEIPNNLNAFYGQKLSDVKLPEGFSWQDPDTSVGDPGENTFKCDYAAPDENHTGAEGIEVKVRVMRPVDASMFEVASDGLAYTGKALEPAVSSSIIPDNSYEVSYRNNVDAGKAAVVIKGKGFYTGSCEVPFQIAKAKPSFEVPTGIKATYGQKLSEVKLPDGFTWQDQDASVDWYGNRTVSAIYTPSDLRNYERVSDIDINVFTGRNVIPVPKVEDMTFNGSLQAPDIDIDGAHIVKNDGGLNVGSYTIQIALDDSSVDAWDDGSNGEKSISYQIVPADISSANFDDIAPCLLNDGKAEPAISGSFNGASLIDGSDYSVSYKDNTAVGVGSAVIYGKGNFKGSRTLKFRIAKADLNDYSLSIRQDVFLYKGAPIEPRVWVTGSGMSKSLQQGVDYLVAYTNNNQCGTGHITVQGIGDYIGSNSKDFAIVDTIDLNKYCNARCDNALFDGSAVSPSVHVTLKTESYDEAFGNDGASRCTDAPIEGRDFTVSYENNEAPGIGTAVISGCGRYSGVMRVNFNILRKNEINLDDCIVDIDPSGDFERLFYGYGKQFEFAYTGSEIKPRVKVIYISAGVSVTLNQDADFRVSYSSNVNPGSASIYMSGINGVLGSNVVSFSIVRKIPISDLGLSVSDLVQSEYVLAPGFSIAPKLKSYPDFIEGADYKLTYKNCDKVGNGFVTVTGIGRFTGSIDIPVSIVSSLNMPLLSDCSIDAIPDQTYTGSAIYPRVSIRNPIGISVDTSRECSLTYLDNVKVGKATVIAGEQEGLPSSSYLGSLYASFNIVAADINSAEFSPIGSQIYSGNAIEPSLNLTYNGKALIKGIDYDVSYSDNIKVGVAHGLIVGKGNFTGQRSFTFDIKSPQLSFSETMTEGETSFASWSSGINTTRFRILMDEGGMVSICTRYSGLESVLCSIRNAQGDIVYSWAPRDGQEYGYFALPAGIYYFEYFGSVSAHFGSVSASYTCDSFWTSSDTVYEIEDNSGTRDGHSIDGDATPIQVGKLFAGSNYNTITGYGDLDYFKFTVTSESRYSMLLMTPANMMFALEDSSGKVLLNSDTGESLVAQTLNGQSAGLDFGSLKPGTYYVLVLSKDQTAVGKPYFGCVRESSQPAVSQGGIDRVSGNTRYDTMGSLSKRGNWGWGGTAILSSGANYPDALAASSLAGGCDAPILLTDPKVLSDACKQELDWLRPSTLYIVGGSSAVSDAVESQVRSLLGSNCVIRRIAGKTRYETSLAVAKSNPAHSDTVVVATGLNYADALSISPYAFASGSPVILCDSSSGLIDEAVNSIRGGGYSKAVIVGGYSAVPKGVECQLTRAGVDSVTRLSGATRYETSIKISDFELASGLGFSMDGVLFATGSNFPDALAAGPLAGRMRSPLLLVDSGARIVSGYLSTHKGEVKSATVVGGVNAIPESDKRQLERALNI